jgi:hypothetical protein
MLHNNYGRHAGERTPVDTKSPLAIGQAGKGCRSGVASRHNTPVDKP